MAPSTTSALHPIVIDPFQVPPHFTTLGTGLLYDSHARESASTLKTLLLSRPPLLTNQSKPKSWWRAQCLLYGLSAPLSRTVQDLRETLEMALEKPGGLTAPGDLVELEHKENGKFRKLNAQVREATGRGGDAARGKGGGTAPGGNKTNAKPSKTTANANKDVIAGSGKGKKAASEKDPLKIVKGAPKVKKPQSINNTSNASINLSITIMGTPTAVARPKPTARKGTAGANAPAPSTKQKTVKASNEPKQRPVPKPRTKQTIHMSADRTEIRPEYHLSKPKPRAKQPAVKCTSSNTIKTETNAPKPKAVRAKQTARRTKIEPNVKEEQPRDPWEDEEVDHYSGYMSGHSDSYYYDSDGYRVVHAY